MLFQRRFHAGIRSGAILQTYQIWKAAKVKAGGRYRLGPDGVIEVESVGTGPLGELSTTDARLAGFDDLDALRDELSRSAKTRVTARTRVHRVTFFFVRAEDPREILKKDTSDAALDAIIGRLARMDRLSRRGPWTLELLDLIGRKLRAASSELAPRMQRERRALKADVRKLKELGLTVSHEGRLLALGAREGPSRASGQGLRLSRVIARFAPREAPLAQVSHRVTAPPRARR